jgi:hypothetical protein
MEVLITLGKIGKKAEPASNAIAQIAAKTSKQDVLEEAAIALARIGKKEEVEKLLADDSRQKKIAGIVALTAMTDSRKEILENAIFLDEERKKNGTDKKKLSGDILTPSVILTVRKRGADAAPVLADALSLVHHVYVRENLAKALGEIGNGSEVVVNALVEGLLDTTQKNPYVQIAAIRSLEKLASKADAAKAAMIRVAEDPVFEERVRLVAQTAVFANIELDKSSESQKLAKESMYDEGLNKYYKIHPFAFEKNYLYRIDLISKNFDSFLYLKRGKTTIAFDDDSGGDLNARLFYKPQDDEKLEIWATTYPRNALGDYQLEIRKLPASPTKK